MSQERQPISVDIQSATLKKLKKFLLKKKTKTAALKELGIGPATLRILLLTKSCAPATLEKIKAVVEPTEVVA